MQTFGEEVMFEYLRDSRPRLCLRVEEVLHEVLGCGTDVWWHRVLVIGDAWVSLSECLCLKGRLAYQQSVPETREN